MTLGRLTSATRRQGKAGRVHSYSILHCVYQQLCHLDLSNSSLKGSTYVADHTSPKEDKNTVLEQNTSLTSQTKYIAKKSKLLAIRGNV